MKKQVSGKTRISLLVLFLMLLFHFTNAQALTDSTAVEPIKKEKKGSIFSGRPGKAFLLSLILPGTGQIYNKSYLRLPFVYGAVGGMGWLVDYNTKIYRCRKMAYKSIIDQGFVTVPDNCKEKEGLLNKNAGQLRSLRDDANQHRQTAIIYFSLIWLANGIDAFVDAHLKNFNIDDDLGINVGPILDHDPFVPSRVGVTVNF